MVQTLACTLLAVAVVAAQPPTEPQAPFQERGYYITFMRMRAIENRHREAKSEGERQLLRIAQWVLGQWEGDNRTILE